MTWWRDGVLYQIYPRSFADSNGDGVGDLRGIIDRLDHLAWLGIDGIWLNPTMPSPNEDWGYDVSDYRGVHPDLGTLEDLDALIADAGERGIHLLLDLVPNHTSIRHPWFRERPDFYVWADGKPPNNWLSNFGGSAWTRDDARGASYLHNFLESMPDLDWWNEAVRDEFDDILRFWFARGVAGFRIDVCHGIVKDRELRDDPAAPPEDHPMVRRRGLRQVFSMNARRCTRSCGAGGRSPTRATRRACSWGRRTCWTSTSSSPTTARARTSSTSPSTSSSSMPCSR